MQDKGKYLRMWINHEEICRMSRCINFYVSCRGKLEIRRISTFLIGLLGLIGMMILIQNLKLFLWIFGTNSKFVK